MKFHRKKRVSGILFLFALAFSFLFSCPESQCAEYSIKPSITASEEYDDNIFLTKEDKKDDYITRATPSLALSYKTPWWDLALDYRLFWRYYAKLAESRNSHYADLISKMDIINKFLYLDITDRYENVVLDPRQHFTETNLDVNKTDSNTLTASPYIKYPFTPVLMLSTGYRYTNIWYREGAGTNRQLHTAFASLERQFSGSFTGSINAEYTADRPEQAFSNSDRTSAFIKITYAMNPRTSFDGSVGYTSISFSGDGTTNRPLYDARLTYSFYGTGKLELRANSAILDSAEFGVYESRMEQASVTYGTPLQFNGRVFHKRDKYGDISVRGRTDEIVGVAGGLDYKATSRLTYNISARYERDRYKPQDQERDIFGAAIGLGYKLTPKATLGVYYHYDRSTGDIQVDSYSDNVVGIQMRIEI